MLETTEKTRCQSPEGIFTRARAEEINNIFLDLNRRIKTWSQRKQKKMDSLCLSLAIELKVKWKSLSRVQLSETSWTIQSMDSPGQNTGVGSLSLLQGIFPTQGSNPGLPHCRRILYQLNHQGSPRILEWVLSSWSSRPTNQIGIFCIAGRLPAKLPGNPQSYMLY